MQLRDRINYKSIGILLTFSLLSFLFYSILPNPLFTVRPSAVLYDSEGNLMNARISEDGQWRFFSGDTLPDGYEKSLLEFEDRNFYYHPGIDPFALIRALVQNVKAGRTESGGSTITMQLARMINGRKARTAGNKLFEMLLALRLELSYSKSEILKMYAANAPFGGNVSGIEAAAWRFYGKPLQAISLGESATLAVLPNAPSLIFPGKNSHLLKAKRNRLLNKLLVKNKISEGEYFTAINESLPGKPHKLPSVAPHLLDLCLKKYPDKRLFRSTIHTELQQNCTDILDRHYQLLKGSGIMNGAVLVVDNRNGDVIAYVGNTTDKDNRYSNEVDIVQSPRSYGSLLKPLLFAALIDDGSITSSSLIPDIPTEIGGFAPKNYYETYDGAVRADEMVKRSLNVPAVRMLHRYGTARFLELLRKMGLSSLHKPAGHYGLSLILGGGESSLWELVRMYSCSAARLNQFNNSNHKSYTFDFLKDKSFNNLKPEDIPLQNSSLYFMFEAMNDLTRPGDDMYWDYYGSGNKISWKTGTSFGNRDAWAIGVNADYTVGVWVGNATGEGVFGLTGIEKAAPILFDVFRLTNSYRPFIKPVDEMIPAVICSRSGYTAGPYCLETDTTYCSPSVHRLTLCSFDKLLSLDKTGTYRVDSDCESPGNIQMVQWFVLPPLQEYYYSRIHAGYALAPPFRSDCGKGEQTKTLDIIYPRYGSSIYIPGGDKNDIVLEAVHSRPGARIFWHIDSEYQGETRGLHKLNVTLKPGNHLITIVDEDGNSMGRMVEVLNR